MKWIVGSLLVCLVLAICAVAWSAHTDLQAHMAIRRSRSWHIKMYSGGNVVREWKVDSCRMGQGYVSFYDDGKSVNVYGTFTVEGVK